MFKKPVYAEKLFRNWFSVFAIVLSATILSFAVISGWWAFLGPIAGVFMGSVLGFVFVFHLSPVNDKVATIESKGLNNKLSFSIIFLYIASIYALHHGSMMSRPLLTYLLLSFVCLVLVVQILSENGIGASILQIIMVFAPTYYTSQIAYPAGAYNVDTERLIPMIQSVIAQAGVDPSMFYSVTPSHQVFVSILAIVSDGNVESTYIWASLFVMTVSILGIYIVCKCIPILSKQEILFAILLYAAASFTLRRGLFPFKGNFMRPLILIASAYSLKMIWNRFEKRYFYIVVVSFLMLVTGHQYSSGMATIILCSFMLYAVVAKGLDSDQYSSIPTALVLSLLVMVSFLSYSIYSTEHAGIIKRIAGLLASLANIGASQGSSGGRYTSFNFLVLLLSTVGQFILYMLGIAGIAVAIRRKSPELDSVFTWVSIAFIMLGLSAFVNAFVIPTPRVHGLLAMFGLNIFAAIGICSLRKVTNHMGTTRFNIGVSHIVIIVFVVFSLASPIAGASLSIVDDQVPQYRKFDTNSEGASDAWADTYGVENIYRMQVPASEVPIDIVKSNEPARGVTAAHRLPAGSIYQYKILAAERGIRVDNQPILGGRNYAFIYLSTRSQTDDLIYSNGRNTFYINNENM
jgi:hypothetical protein